MESHGMESHGMESRGMESRGMACRKTRHGTECRATLGLRLQIADLD